MTRKRVQSLSRLVGVQTQLHHAAQARLAQLRREEAEIEQEKCELIAALNGDGVLRGLFFDAAIRRMKALTAKGDAVRRAREAQTQEALRHGGRLKQAERMLASAKAVSLRESEKRMLADIVDDLAANDASLP